VQAVAERLVTSQCLASRGPVRRRAIRQRARFARVDHSLFRWQASTNKVSRHPSDMTRFLMTLDESIDLITPRKGRRPRDLVRACAR